MFTNFLDLIVDVKIIADLVLGESGRARYRQSFRLSDQLDLRVLLAADADEGVHVMLLVIQTRIDCCCHLWVQRT